jgi:dihydropyrimidinase
MTYLIKSGTIITATETFSADLLIKGDKIAQIGEKLVDSEADVIDAAGKLIMPGGVDPHTHFDLPMFGTISSDDHYTGHKAAAFGGTTTVIDFVPQDAPTLKDSIAIWQEKAAPKAAIDYGFHMNITQLNRNIEQEIPTLPDFGISSVKVFMAYNGRLRLEDGEIFKVMRIARECGLLTMLHAENGDIIEILVEEALKRGDTSPIWHAYTRPSRGAVEAAFRGAAIAAQADAPLYLVHMNASGEVDQLAYARERGLPIMGETCPQYLFFTEDDLKRPDGPKWICSPPMRTKHDNERLWGGLSDGTIQTIGTDHCPFFYDGTQAINYEGQPVAIPGKELGVKDFTKIPNGLPAVGDRLPILWTYGVGRGRITANQFVNLTSTNPAKIFGLYPRKGALSPGSDADIVIWDPDRSLTYGVGYAHHRTDYNLFEGWELVGYPEKVLLRGRILVDGHDWFGLAGSGMYLNRQTGSPSL